MPTQRIDWRLSALVLTLLGAHTALSIPAAASPEGDAARSAPSLTEVRSLLSLSDPSERARAFRDALAGLEIDPEGLIESPASDTWLLESHWSVDEGYFEIGEVGEVGELDPPALPGRRDLVFEEQWLLAGREDDHESAARHWLGRQVKSHGRRDRSSGGSGWRGKLAWDHGPMTGVGRGPVSIRAGESHWRLQWSKRWARSGGPWRAKVMVGEEDGVFHAEFLIGRTVLDAFGD